MNRIHPLIGNDKTGIFAGVAGKVKSIGKNTEPCITRGRGRVSFTLKVLAISLISAFNVYALPQGGIVSAGNASISSGGSSAIVTQSTKNVVINWQSFNIATGQTVRFVQPDSSSVALNRVTGSDPSSILGSLEANGKIFLVNPYGILFGQSASVNVSGLLASTLNITDRDLMASNYHFTGAGSGVVRNLGTINTNANGGYVALLGANVSNDGIITAKLGSVVLAAGTEITVDVAGDGLLNVTVNQGVVNGLVQNGGLIQADGGQVLLTAQAAGSLLSSVVNNTGVIQAQTIESHNGTIKLLADMQSGTLNVGGILDASAPNGGDGGFIETSASHVLLANSARVNTLAPFGHSGLWLLDPVNWTIALAAGDETPTQVVTSLASSNRLISVTNNITVTDPITWSTAQTLTLNAGNDVLINAAMTASTAGSGIKLIATHDILAAPGAAMTASANGSVIDMSAGHDVSVYTVTASGGGAVMLSANHDVIVNGAITADTAVPAGSSPVILLAGNDGLGVGTVKFAGGGQVSSTLTTIRFNPVNYASTGAEIAAYLPKVVAGAMDAKAWVYAQANNKVYDRNTAAILSFNGDPTVGGLYSVTLAPGVATFVDWNAGNGKTVNYTGYDSISGPNTVSGAAVSYALFSNTTPGVTSANITAKPVILTAPAVSKVYDGGTAYTAGTADLLALSTPLIAGDTVTAASIAYTNRNAGTGNKSVNLNAATISDGNGGLNYIVTPAGNITSTITKAALGINAVTDSKVYDGGTTSAGVVSFAGLVGGDTVSGAIQSFGSRNVLGVNGSILLVTPASYTVNDGNTGSNYVVTVNTATGTISPKALGVNAVSDTRIYDGGTTSAGVVSFSGLVGGDSVSGAIQSYASRNVLGTNGSTLLVTPASYTVNDGNTGNNYVATLNNAQGTISKAALGINAVSDIRIYDGGTTSAGVVSFAGLVGGDSVIGAIQSYASRNVLGTNGSTLLVTPASYTVNDGNAGNNYAVTMNTATGTISPKALGINAVSNTRVYDGGTTSAGVVNFSGLVGGDSVSGAIQSFGSRNVLGVNGSILLVTPASYTVNDGNTGSNYVVTVNTATGTISPKALGVNAVSDTRIYDGGTTSAGVVSFSGLVGGDSVSGAIQSYASRNVLGTNGSTLLVTPASYTVNDGNTGNNYVVTVNTATGTISQKALGINAVSDTRIYDGGTTSAGVVSFSGLVGGDSVSGAIQSYASRNVLGANGSILLVTPGSYTVSDGNTGNNYVATLNTATGTITALGITGHITAANKNYDSSMAATITGRTLVGVISPDQVSYSDGTGRFDTSNAGIGKTVTGSGLALSGADAGNYTVNTTATTTANIMALPVLVPFVAPSGKPGVVQVETPLIKPVIVMPVTPANFFELAPPVLLSVLLAEPASLLTLLPGGVPEIDSAALPAVRHDSQPYIYVLPLLKQDHD